MENPHLFIGTHHKSGTVWLMTTFRRLAKFNGFWFVHLNTGEIGWEIRSDKAEFFESQRAMMEAKSDEPCVFADFHSAFPSLEACKRERGARGLHIVRDPRDMILSAVRFHLVSDESWLHDPMDQLGGKSYQQHLRSLSSLEEQASFEMDQYMGRAIAEMSGFDRQGVFLDVRYEDLINDHEMKLWRELSGYLGLKNEQIDHSLDAFWRSSVFGERSAHDQKIGESHIFNSRPAQWMKAPVAVIDRIEERYRSEIAGLGYPLRSEAGV